MALPVSKVNRIVAKAVNTVRVGPHSTVLSIYRFL